MYKLIVLIFLLLPQYLFAQTKFGLSGATFTSISVEDESQSMVGTIITPDSGISFNYAYKASFLEVGFDLTYAQTAKIDEETTDQLEYEVLMGGPYLGLNFYIFKPFVGYQFVNLKYKDTDESLDSRYDGYAPYLGLSISVYKCPIRKPRTT